MTFFRCLLFAALAGSAFAQSDDRPARKVFLRLLAFDGASIPEESYAFDPALPEGGGVGIEAPIKGYLNHEGVSLALRGSQVRFMSSSKVEDLKRPESLLAQVTLPKKGTRFILIFLPGGKTKFQVFALDESLRAFPTGSYRVFNLSKHPVRLMLEKKGYEFQPGKSSLITDPPVRKNNHSAMKAAVEVDGKWQRIGSGLWPHPGRKRSIQMFFDNPVSKKTELRGFRDVSPPTRAAPREETP